MIRDASHRSGAHRAPAPRRQALVVAPDRSLRAFAARALDIFEPGFHVATARDPREALGWLETVRPSLVVLLPEGPGEAGDWERLLLDPRLDGVPAIWSAPGGAPPFPVAWVARGVELGRPLRLADLLEAARALAGPAPPGTARPASRAPRASRLLP